MTGSAPPPPRSEDPQDAYDAAFRDIVAHFADPGRPPRSREEPGDAEAAPSGHVTPDGAPRPSDSDAGSGDTPSGPTPRPAGPVAEHGHPGSGPGHPGSSHPGSGSGHPGPGHPGSGPGHPGSSHPGPGSAPSEERDSAPEDLRLDPTRNVDESPDPPGGTTSWATADEAAAPEPRPRRADPLGPASDGRGIPLGGPDAPPPGWRVHIPPDDPDDEHYQPPPPTPLLSHDPTFWAAVIGCVGGPLWFLYLVLTDPYGSRMAMWAAGLLTAAGFAVTVVRLPRRVDTDPDDDGARV